MTWDSPYAASLAGLVLCAITMAATWAWASSRPFLSIVDAVWAFGIGALSTLYFAMQGQWTIQKIASLVLVLIWSGRLSSHLALRLVRHFPQEDRRYQDLSARWEGSFGSKSFAFFQFQAFTQGFFAFPLAAIASAPAGRIASFFWVGALVCVLGLMGESASDAQLKRFVSDPRNRGQVCDRGLWRYSRHPNYFFEWVTWCGFGAMGAAAPYGWLSVACPLAMLALLLFVTGVPPAEASSLRSKGQLYRDYQARTNRFVPWIPKPSRVAPKEAA